MVSTDAFPDAQVSELLERRLQLFPRGEQRPNFAAHALDRSRLERSQREVRRRRGNVVRRLRVAQHLDQRGLRQRHPKPSTFQGQHSLSRASLHGRAHRIAASPKLLLSVCITQMLA